MLKLKYLIFLLSLSFLYVNQSSACEVVMNDFHNEIRTLAEESKIKELNGCYYVDSSLLDLREDGIHLIYGDKDIVVPFMYHDTKGYFLSPQACWDLGNEWMCCRCNNSNSMFTSRCRVCLNKRCGT